MERYEKRGHQSAKAIALVKQKKNKNTIKNLSLWGKKLFSRTTVDTDDTVKTELRVLQDRFIIIFKIRVTILICMYRVVCRLGGNSSLTSKHKRFHALVYIF